MKFIHTADWQLGKPFNGVEDATKRALLQNERVETIKKMGVAIQERHAEFMLVAGDLFDSPSADKATVAAACSAIGSLGVPVYAIPGNHDHGGPGSLWEQEFFKRQQNELAPNFKILLSPEPVVLESVVLFPCPLLRRHEPADLTAWLRPADDFDARFGDKPRIVIAHGSVQGFGAFADDEESGGGAPNLLDLTRLPEGAFDYIALGDWHGTKDVGTKAWYSGTPELDRFVKGGGHDPGNILLVEPRRGQSPAVQRIRTGTINWHEVIYHFPDDSSLAGLQNQITQKIGQGANKDLLRLQLSGALGIKASGELAKLIEAWSARLLRVKSEDKTVIAPSVDEMAGLKSRAADPLISRVAGKLEELAKSADESESAVARIALRELYLTCNR